MKETIKDSTLYIIMGLLFVMVGTVLLFNKEELATSYYRHNVQFVFNEATQSDIQELGLDIEPKKEGTYDDLMDDIYSAYINLYYLTQEELDTLITMDIDIQTLKEQVKTDDGMVELLSKGQYTQHIYKTGFKRLSWLQSIERLGGTYNLIDAFAVIEAKDPTTIDLVIYMVIYYGWMFVYLLAFTIIYYGIVELRLNKHKQDYTEEELEEHQTYYDNYYEAYRNQRAKKVKQSREDDLDNLLEQLTRSESGDVNEDNDSE